MIISNLTQANLFELSSCTTKVSFSDTSILGGPQLNYSSLETSRNFMGEEIQMEETSIGRLISVILEQIPDLRSVSFTLILPAVNVSMLGEKVELKVPGIVTTTLTTIVGPPEGVEKTYLVEEFQGNAQFIVS